MAGRCISRKQPRLQGNRAELLKIPKFGSQSPQERGQRVHREVACVGGSLRQTSDFLYQIFPAQPPSFVQIFAFDQLRDRRSASHRWNAALGEKANVCNPLPLWLPDFQSDAKFKNVSTNRIFQSRSAVRGFNCARIARVLKVVEKRGRIHKAIVMPYRRQWLNPKPKASVDRNGGPMPCPKASASTIDRCPSRGSPVALPVYSQALRSF